VVLTLVSLQEERSPEPTHRFSSSTLSTIAAIGEGS